MAIYSHPRETCSYAVRDTCYKHQPKTYRDQLCYIMISYLNASFMLYADMIFKYNHKPSLVFLMLLWLLYAMGLYTCRKIHMPNYSPAKLGSCYSATH